MVVLANCKSGSKEGDLILSCFRRLLNPAQAVDLSRWPPQAALEWCQLLAPTLSRPATVLVAGGDGTVGWVLNAVYKLKLEVCDSYLVQLTFSLAAVSMFWKFREDLRLKENKCTNPLFRM